MTKEEAIQILERRRFYSNYGAGLNEVLDMAIEALSADTVSRSQYQGLLNAIGKVYVEVVRCKDCRFAEHGTMIDLEEAEKTPRHYLDWIKCHNCDIHKGVRFVEEDDFCSWAERREPCD